MSSPPRMDSKESKFSSKWKLPGIEGVLIGHYIDQYGRFADVACLAT